MFSLHSFLPYLPAQFTRKLRFLKIEPEGAGQDFQTFNFVCIVNDCVQIKFLFQLASK